MVSGFTPKRYSGINNMKLTAGGLAKDFYAFRYGYESRGGGWIYGSDGKRVCRGWEAFGQLLVDTGKITDVGTPSARITPRFAVGDRITFESRGELRAEVVEAIEYDGMQPVYSFTSQQNGRGRIFDYCCSQQQTQAA
jgi:hypothetical protein